MGSSWNLFTASAGRNKNAPSNAARRDAVSLSDVAASGRAPPTLLLSHFLQRPQRSSRSARAVRPHRSSRPHRSIRPQRSNRPQRSAATLAARCSRISVTQDFEEAGIIVFMAVLISDFRRWASASCRALENVSVHVPADALCRSAGQCRNSNIGRVGSWRGDCLSSLVRLTPHRHRIQRATMNGVGDCARNWKSDLRLRNRCDWPAMLGAGGAFGRATAICAIDDQRGFRLGDRERRSNQFPGERTKISG